MSDQTIADVLRSVGAPGERVIGLAVVGTISNLLLELCDNMGEGDIQSEIIKLQEMIGTKMEEIMDMPVGASE